MNTGVEARERLGSGRDAGADSEATAVKMIRTPKLAVTNFSVNQHRLLGSSESPTQPPETDTSHTRDKSSWIENNVTNS